MSISVIIPAYNEGYWINRTIQNILTTATGRIQIIVVDYGGNGEIDRSSGKVLLLGPMENKGERFAMNEAATRAKCSHLLRIDAHCDFSPKGWDRMMEEVTGPKTMTQTILTATDGDWKRKEGHWYERTRLLPNMEAKWEKPNKEKSLPKLVPNMSSTGCGFMMRKDFYVEIGGANEEYPPMGAIGEEFAVKTWLNGGKVQTITTVIIGHIFGDDLKEKDKVNRGYSTDGVLEARACLVRDFGGRYGEIRAKFPDLDWEASESLKPTANNVRDREGIDVWRDDITIHRRGAEITEVTVKVHHYKWIPSEHTGEENWTQEQIRLKYAPGAPFYQEITCVPLTGTPLQFEDYR